MNNIELHIIMAVMLFIIAGVCLVLGINAVKLAQKMSGSWKPWPMNLDWALAGFFLLTDLPIYGILGVSTLLAPSKEPVELWGILLVLETAVWPIVLFYFWASYRNQSDKDSSK